MSGWYSRTAPAAALLMVGALLFTAVDRGAERPAELSDSSEPKAAGERRGALVDQVVFTQESDLGRLAELVKSGSHHLFGVGVTNSTIFRAIRDSADIDYEMSYGSSAELTFNPAGPRFENGRINPFHLREIREAMHWLVDRRYIAEELYGGLAVPRYLPLDTPFPDYARLAEVARTLELRYAHDPERARRVIQGQMQALGAELQNGHWAHEDQVIRLRLLIRVDDERRRVGDYLANLLEDLGFAVDRLYREADEASRIWLAGDPRLGQWHVYTGGWVSRLIKRDKSYDFTYFFMPRGRPEPLWQIYTPDPEFDELASRLERRDYTRWEERQELMARATELAMEDAVRIWLTDQLNVWPRAVNLELAMDLAGGVYVSALWPYTLRFTDRLGGRVLVGTSSLLTEPWNLVAGTNWVFDKMILRALGDPAVLPDPFTGLFHPQRLERAEVTVQEDVPVIRTLDWLTLEHAPEITVPEDAWIDWDSREQRWVTVGERHAEGLTARTRVVLHYEEGYLERRWHDGTQVSLADMVLPWILSFERADQESRLFDPADAASFEAYRQHFRGRRIVSTDPLVIEVYSDQIYPDAEWIAAWRTPTLVEGAAREDTSIPAMLPWHRLTLGIFAEQAGELAFSSNKADRERVDWMSLVAGPSLGILQRHLERARDSGLVPYAAVLETYMRPGEAEERYAALAEWHRRYGHFWVGDGPFYLRSVHPVERTVVLERFADFPDPADKWLRFSQPRIPAVDLDGPMVIQPGEGARFEIHVSFEGEAYPEESVERVAYMLFDRTGRLAREGDAAPEGGGRWNIELTAEQLAELGSGASSLEVVVTSLEVALPTFATQVFATVPQIGVPLVVQPVAE